MPDGPEQLAARRTFTIVLALGAFLAGALVVGLIATLTVERVQVVEGQRAAAQAAFERERVEEVLGAARDAEPRLEGARAEAPAERRESLEGWFSEALQAFALEGLARGWAEVRDDPLPEDLAAVGLSRFREQVEALPRRIGRDLGREQGRRDLIATGVEQVGVFTVLDAIDEQLAGPMPELVEDGQRFGATFTCDLPGPVIPGDEFLRTGGPEAGLADGTTIRFGPGVGRVYQWVRRGAAPRCMTIEGAGMDQTLLVAPPIPGMGTTLDRLTIRDCTIYARALLQMRNRGAQVLVERVRVVGFDEGADSGTCLTLDRTALLMRDCRFEAGYGKDAKAVGRLFDVRGDSLLARFERCRFDGIYLGLRHLPRRTTVVFSECLMTDLRDREDPRTLDRPGLSFVDCSVTLGNPDDGAVRGRDMEQLFPGWREAR